MINLYSNKNKCSGCTACYSICPKTAISMNTDNEGFFYPKINHERCTECGLCKKVCAFNEDYDKKNNYQNPLVFAAKHVNENERMSSRSGGVFVGLANYVLKKSGLVYGAAFNQELEVCHRSIEKTSEIKKLKGSKYVQSDLGNTFIEIKEELKKDKYVLFSGTPCQTAGLSSFLENRVSKEKLILVDIVCHGVPSPLVYNDYMRYIEKKYKKTIKTIDFRDKSYGWDKHLETIYFDDGKQITLDYYATLYYKHITLRPSCSECKFTNLHRPSDITLADFWGIENCIPGFDDNRGVSLVLINTKKGNKIFSEISNEITFEKCNNNKYMQRNLISPTQFSSQRELFWKEYELNDFEYIVKKYMGGNLKSNIKRNIKKVLNKQYKINLFGADTDDKNR